MKAWRGLLSSILSSRGYEHGEVDIECLHWLGWKGEDLGSFLSEAYAAQAPFAAICIGFDQPFALTFSFTHDKSLRPLQGGFAVKFDEPMKQLALRPLSYLNVRELPREPFYPKTMSGTRVPTQLSWSLAVEPTSGQGWNALHRKAAKDGFVRALVTLRKLPSGDVSLALPGEGPALLKTYNPVPNADKTIAGARFAKVNVSKEALALLNGDDPEALRVRDLDAWHHITEVAPLSRRPGTTNLIGRPAGPAVLSTIQEYVQTSPETDSYDCCE